MTLGTIPSIQVLRQRHLSLLWSAQVFSAFGDRLHEIAIVWLSVQLVGASAGYVLAAGALSRLAFGLLAGVFADRWDRYKTLIGADLARAAAVLTLPLATLWGDITLPHLALVAAIIGALGSLFEPTLIAALPDLTRNRQLLQAMNGLMDVTSRLAKVIAPGLAGWLIAIMPLSHFFTIDAMTYGASALVIGSLGYAFTQKRKVASNPGRQGVIADIRGALRLIQKHRPLYWGLAAIFVINIAWSAAFTVGVALLVDEKFGGGVRLYGLIVAAYGVGNVLSNLVIGNMTISNRTMTMFAGKVVVGLGFLLLAFAPTASLAMVASGLAALGGPMDDLMLLLFIQQDFPKDQIGKIYSARMTISNTGASLGLLLASPLFGLVDVSLGIAFCAMLMIGAGVVGLLRFWGPESAYTKGFAGAE